jgi:lipopolysaccharide/colanic/teichoic acid biosynthesis glycosyltransferase
MNTCPSHNRGTAKAVMSDLVFITNGLEQSGLSTGVASPDTCDILNEKALAKLLSLERKRTDRSGRRFILMLLDATALLTSKSHGRAFDHFIRTLADTTRETDAKGWYKDEAIFGVVFTEIGDGDSNAIIQVLHGKVANVLWNTLRFDDVNSIHLSFHVYPPEESGTGDEERPPDLKLYPDQAPEQDPRRLSRNGKRAIDIVGSLCGLLVLAPLMLAIAAAIKLTSRGPVLFCQRRVGRYGATFTFLKFRSMYLANDDSIHKEYVTQFISGKQAASITDDQNGVFKIKNDPRVTRVGKWLRRTSLDELPQLLNVLHGEMSLVGPRPPVPYEVACYALWHKRRLLNVKPGITGLWQVSGRSRVRFDDMVRLDLEYAKTWSVWLDLKIILKTPAAVLSGEGAY